MTDLTIDPKTTDLNTTDPKTLAETDPTRHTIQVRTRLTELAQHLRDDVQKVDDPAFKALFETTAAVLVGLETAVAGYEEKKGEAWNQQ
jgi:hypothetical protein